MRCPPPSYEVTLLGFGVSPGFGVPPISGCRPPLPAAPCRGRYSAGGPARGLGRPHPGAGPNPQGGGAIIAPPPGPYHLRAARGGPCRDGGAPRRAAAERQEEVGQGLRGRAAPQPVPGRGEGGGGGRGRSPGSRPADRCPAGWAPPCAACCASPRRSRSATPRYRAGRAGPCRVGVSWAGIRRDPPGSAVLSWAVLCRAAPHRAVLRHALPYHAELCHAMPCYSTPYHVTLCRALLCCAVPC